MLGARQHHGKQDEKSSRHQGAELQKQVADGDSDDQVGDQRQDQQGKDPVQHRSGVDAPENQLVKGHAGVWKNLAG